MIKRYSDSKISEIWTTENKLRLWQKVELAVIQARVNLSQLEPSIYQAIKECLEKNEIDVEWFENKDKEINHDLNAFIEERTRHLSPELQAHFHHEMTSYDTEEPAFAIMLRHSYEVICKYADQLVKALEKTAVQYRYTPMMGKTHGQDAELQTFGMRCLRWYSDFKISLDTLDTCAKQLRLSKISGAIGNYTQICPEIEKEALSLLDLAPFYGASQIMPRELFVPFASALCQTVLTIQKIALSIRLGARSGLPLYQEPFSKKQKGSSAMPHKKNTIITERLEGVSRLALSYHNALTMNVVTWEERAIEQSSVERVAWPDLLHATTYALKQMEKLVSGLVVYPENMMKEILNTRGMYASARAKEFLRQRISEYGLDSEDAYRIVQLASFNVFSGHNRIYARPFSSLDEAEMAFEGMQTAVFVGARSVPYPENISIAIRHGRLTPVESLEATPEKVEKWNAALREMFHKIGDSAWDSLFKIKNHLRGEEFLFHQVFDI